MQVFINEGSTTMTLAHDTISLNYFEMDGCSFCGARTLDVFPELSWLNINNCAVTIESTEGTDLEIFEDLNIDVTLDITTVTDQWNPMEEWLTTAPEGMGEATTRYTMNGNTIVYNEDQIDYNSVISYCRNEARNFDKLCADYWQPGRYPFSDYR